jgi:hypothetical protein
VGRGWRGWGVAAEVVGEGLEDGVVGAADQLAVVGGDAVEGAVAQADGAVGVVGGFVAAAGWDLAEGGRDLGWVALGGGGVAAWVARSVPRVAAWWRAAWAVPEGSAATALASRSARAASSRVGRLSSMGLGARR